MARYQSPTSAPDNGIGALGEETAAMLAEARGVIACEAELQNDRPEDRFTPPVLSRGDVRRFQREWLRRPQLRCLIRAAGALPPEGYAGNLRLRALWELSQSPEWRREPGGRIPIEFAPLLDGGGAP